MRNASLSSVVLGAAVIVCVAGSGAMAQSGPFAKFQGAWSGSGQIRLDGDKMEQVKCKAYYTDKEKGSGLGLALRMRTLEQAGQPDKAHAVLDAHNRIRLAFGQHHTISLPTSRTCLWRAGSPLRPFRAYPSHPAR